MSTTERNAFWDMESDFGGGVAAEVDSQPGMDILIDEIRRVAGRAPRQKAERPTVPCPKCNGTGRWFRGLECFKCSGTGQVKGLLQDEASVKRRQKAAERRAQKDAPPVAPEPRRLPYDGLRLVRNGSGSWVMWAGRWVAKARGGQIWFVPGLPDDLTDAVKKLLDGRITPQDDTASI